jgi:hypothetical protein
MAQVLYLPMDADFDDDSPSSHIVTKYGGQTGDVHDATIDANQGKFVRTSDYVGQYVLYPDIDYFGLQNFTLGFKCKFTTKATLMEFVTQCNSSGNTRILFFWNTDNTLWFYVDSSGTNIAYYTCSFTPATNGTEYHIEFDRDGSNFYIFIDGVSKTLTVNKAIGSSNLPDVVSLLNVGRNNQGYPYNFFFDGYMRQLYIQNGVALHTSGFTVPSNFTPDKNTTLFSEMYSDFNSYVLPAIDTSIKDIGVGSGNFNKENGQYLSITDSADFDYASYDFDIIGYLYLKSHPTLSGLGYYFQLLEQSESSTDKWGVTYGESGGAGYIQLFCYVGGVTRCDIIANMGFLPSLNTWYKIKISRVGANIKIYVDDVLKTSSGTDIGANSWSSLSAPLLVGKHPTVGTELYFDGHLDEIEITVNNISIVTKTLSDYVTFTDSIKNNLIVNILQLFTLSDSLSKHSIKNLLSNLGLLDIKSSILNKIFNDNIYFTDQFQRLGIFQLALSSALPLYDYISNRPKKILADDLYLYDYIRVKTIKNIFDNFNFRELFIASYYSISHAVLYIIDDRLGLVDKVEKTARKILSDWLALRDQLTIYILEGDHNRKLYLWSNLSLIDSIAKRIVLVKQDGITLTATLDNNGYLSLQDIVSLQDKIAFRVIKVLNDTIPLTDEITQLLETEPFYFDYGEVYPVYVITDTLISDI